VYAHRETIGKMEHSTSEKHVVARRYMLKHEVAERIAKRKKGCAREVNSRGIDGHSCGTVKNNTNYHPVRSWRR
jgi:hypothetical protein